MSRLFYDKLVELKKIDNLIKKSAKTPKEREEMWLLVDEMIHHRVIGCILDNLPRDSHEEFLEIYHNNPHNEVLILDYLTGRTGLDIADLIKHEVDLLAEEINMEIIGKKTDST